MKLSDFTTLTFDCYGTLIDWEAGMGTALGAWAEASRLDAAPAALFEAFNRNEHRVQDENPAMLYPQILAEVLRGMADDFGVAVSDADARAFGASVGEWPAFPDSPGALAYLKEHYKLVILSNIDRASFSRSNEKLGVAFDAVFTAEDIGSYKPDLGNFHYMLDKLGAMGVAKADILHTAQSLYHDHGPAKELGLVSCWIDRHGTAGESSTTPAPEATPDFRFHTMEALAAAHRAEVA
ncbi:MAG: haloacid dehalogenase type II [Rhodospirillales bacterium]|jgi:2-haloalkanoic acid dehalogenase type II|nr:haloacid dehalogenase type II [Rhodospirillales bacterium]